MQQCSFHDHGEEAHPPPLPELHKATTVIHGQKIILMGFAICKQGDQNQDFCQMLLTMEFSIQWGLSLKLVGAQNTLQDTLLVGKGDVVSDGSYKDAMGVAAWIIEGLTLVSLANGTCQAMGMTTVPFRASWRYHWHLVNVNLLAP